jgi:hypothetical protein
MHNLSIALLHENMLDKNGTFVTTSITLLDIHDIARSVTTFGVSNYFVVHPSEEMRRIAKTIKSHWEFGFGATYNPNRKEALEHLYILSNFDDIIVHIEGKYNTQPVFVATSAKSGGEREPFNRFANTLRSNPDKHYVLLLGTGWGLSEMFLQKAQYFLEPINGFGDYNHLSVRSACAIMLDRITQAYISLSCKSHS